VHDKIGIEKIKVLKIETRVMKHFAVNVLIHRISLIKKNVSRKRNKVFSPENVFQGTLQRPGLIERPFIELNTNG
jgi:hypothetical protein